MRLLYTFIAFLFFFISSYTAVLSQDKLIDSLEHALTVNQVKDTVRVDILDHLSFLYYRKDLDKAIEYIEKAEALSYELNYSKGKGNAIYMRGVVELTKSNYDLAIEHFENAAQIYADNGIQKNIAGCYNGIGIIYSYQGNYEQSSIYYKKAQQSDEEAGMTKNIPNYIVNIGINHMKTGDYPKAIASFKASLKLFTELDNTLGIANSLKNIAVIYQEQGNYPLALEYDNKALSLAKKLQDSSGIANSYNNMAIIYKFQKKYDIALELLEKALSIQEKLENNKAIAGIKNNIATIYIKNEDNITAIKYLEEALEINRKISAKSQLAECLNNLGYVYVSLKKYDDANRYLEEAKNINLEIDYRDGLCYSYLGIADSYMEQKKYNNALTNALKSLEIANEVNLIDYQKEAHKLLAEIYEIKGDYKNALINHQQYKVLNDSLFNKENIEKITQLEYEYKYQERLDSASKRELKLTEKVAITNQYLKKSQRNYLYAIIAFLLVSILLGSIIFYLKFRNVKSKAQNIIMEQKLLRSQMTPHFIFNSLSILQGMILNKEEKKSVSYLSRFSKLLRIILENSRDKMVVLSQEIIAIENYLALQNLENEDFKFSIQIDETIDPLSFKIPPMLIQPFVENAIEHAFGNQKENKTIDIHLSYSDKKLICTITDNGIGVDFKSVDKSKHKKSLATTITNERLKLLSEDLKIKGSVTVEDRKKFNEKGTLVTIVIPYKIS
ncbi:MAG: tetratricopeptide repeat protein [Chitinophagales bacterium]